jgi:hypothetical protein
VSGVGGKCPNVTQEKGMIHFVTHSDGTVDIPILKDRSWLAIYELTEIFDSSTAELAVENYKRGCMRTGILRQVNGRLVLFRTNYRGVLQFNMTKGPCPM